MWEHLNNVSEEDHLATTTNMTPNSSRTTHMTPNSSRTHTRASRCCWGRTPAAQWQPTESEMDAEPPKGSLVNADAADDRAAESRGTANKAAAASEMASWRSSGDVAERLVVARAVIQLIKRRGIDGALGDDLPDVVRLIELSLYRSASSKRAYLDARTLEARVVATVRHRISIAVARRTKLIQVTHG